MSEHIDWDDLIPERKAAKALMLEREAEIGKGKTLDELKEGLSTMCLHNFMYTYAAQNVRKGRKGGDCNRTQCQRPGASCWNRGSRSWYCAKCADELNYHNPMFNEEPMVNEVPDGHYEYIGDPGQVDPTIAVNEVYKLEEGAIDRIIANTNPGLSSGLTTNMIDTYIRGHDKIGRNDKCPCKSGKKFKKCCGA